MTLTIMKVTPGNRGAAVVAGLNIIVFTTIGLLAHRERKEKKRLGQTGPASASLDFSTSSIAGKDEGDFGTVVQTVEVKKL
jgi:ACS family pantothenate transporter-like MFS transporter